VKINMENFDKPHNELKKKIVSETKRYIIYTVILTLFFSAFTTYRRLILEQYGISLAHYGFNLFQSMVLAKVIILGQMFKLGERYSGRPLIIPTLYKTIVFSLFVVAFSVAEHFLLGYFEGKSTEILYQSLMDKRLPEIFAAILPMSFFFLFFFAFLEIEGALSDKTLLDLFFKADSSPRKNL